MALQIRRGLQANLPASPAEGELLYATDTGNLYIGVSGSPQIISFSGGGGASAISDLTDVASVSGITNGQALLWNTANSRFEYGNIPASYGDSDVATYLSNNNYSNVSYGNTEVQAYLDAQSYSNVSYGNTDVQSYLNTQGYATQATIVAAITDSAPATLDTLNELAAALGDDPNFATTVTNSLATKANTSSLHAVATSGDFDDLTNVPVISLAGNDLTFDGTTLDLSSVGAQGPQGIQGNVGPQGTAGVGVSSATVTGANLIISLTDASSIDAGNVVGPQGAAGAQGIQGNVGATGSDGVSVSSATVTGGDLVLTLSNSATINAGAVIGPQGNAGVNGTNGTDGVGITSTSLVGGNLVLNYSNTSTQDVGNIQGPQGDQGAQGLTGATISSASVTNGAITLTMSDATTINVTGNVQGATGAQGAQGNVGPAGNDGTNVTSGTVNGSGNLILTLSDASTIDAGNVRGADGTDGADGDVDQTLSIAGNVITISGSNSNVDLTSALAVNTDAQTLSLGGNVITISGSGSTVDLTSLLGAYVNTDSQALTLSGNTLSISGGNSVDLSSFAGGGIASIGSNVIADLSDVSSTAPTDGQALLWDNGNSTWAPGTVSSGGGASALGDLSDVSTSGATSGQVLKYNGSSWAPAADATSSGGGSGATVERFKLNYASNGNLDSASNTSSGINSVTINSASGGEVTIEFSSSTYNYPPGAIMFYGYDHTNNKYNVVPMETSMGYREIPAGGSSGSPTLFDGSSTVQVKLRLREAETGASRGGFGTTTHAWIQLTMYD